MTRILITTACLFLVVTAQAQKRCASATPEHALNTVAETVLEGKIRKAWADYKSRDKKAFAAILAEGFAEVTNDDEGAVGKDTELAEMDRFTLDHCELKDFRLRSIGNDGALMTYVAEYTGSYDKAPLQMKAIYGEVWIKHGGDWKLLWVQETKLK